MKFTLDQIRESVVFRAHQTRLYSPLKTFFRTMKLKWGDTETAHAQLQDGKPLIVLGEKFFETEIQTIEEAGDVLMHEVMHHLLQHLRRLEAKEFADREFHHVHLATDAMINSILHQYNFSNFMERYYKDEDESAFLRPNSRNFIPKTATNFFGKRKDHRDMNEEEREAYRELEGGYIYLYRQEKTLEQMIEFFEKHFPKSKEDKKQKLLGKPNKRGKPQKSEKGQKFEGEPKDSSERIDGENIFRSEDAERILRDMNLVKTSKETLSNFARVISQITTSVSRAGNIRQGKRISKRIPAKFSRRDMVRMERGMNNFDRADYVSKKVYLFFDDSGSMSAYSQFMIDLAKSLSRVGLQVHVIMWATDLEEVPYQDFIKGTIPNVGSGTTGEVVAKFIARNKITQSIVVTDNEAGELETKITGDLHLCLVKGSTETGSFANKQMVPRVQIHWLEPGSSK